MQHDPVSNPADGMTVEQVFQSNLSKSTKIIFLYELAMANHQQFEGERAWDYIRALTDAETTTAIATISGMALGMSGRREYDWSTLLVGLVGVGIGTLLSKEVR